MTRPLSARAGNDRGGKLVLGVEKCSKHVHSARCAPSDRGDQLLRIHFTADDLALTRLSAEPDPAWEVLLSLHMLQLGDGPLQYGAWRRQMRKSLRPQLLGPLFALARPAGYSPDFLTPDHQTVDFDGAVEAILATPADRVQAELEKLCFSPTASGWAGELARGRPEVMRRLGLALRHYYRIALEPYWPSVQAMVKADHQQRIQGMASGGVAALLDSIHPQARWRIPVLEIPGLPDGDLRLQGRGLRLQPSFFCWRHPTKLLDPHSPQVLVFPISPTGGLSRRGPAGERSLERVGALLGPTRARVLVSSVEGRTTSQLAGACGISPATVSHQTAVLRDAGLIASYRRGKFVVHHTTELGRALLRSGASPASSDLSAVRDQA